MIYCFDTYYYENSANTAVIGIVEWDQSQPTVVLNEVTHNINDYESGAFYKRELPCLTSILRQIELKPHIDVLVVDGYVVLSDDRKLGLGGHLYHNLGGIVPVIGVGKTNFQSLNSEKKEVYRGQSKNPLYITSLGIELNEAAGKIQSMHGEFRIPSILKMVDQKSRTDV